MTLLEIAVLRARTCKFQPQIQPKPQTRIEPPSPPPEPRPPVITLEPDPQQEPASTPTPAPVPMLTVEMIKSIVCAYYNIPMIDLMSVRHTRVIVRPRQVAMYLARHHTTRSLPEIGRRFGGKDHTTVLHAINQITNLIDKDDRIRHDVEELGLVLQSLVQPEPVL